MLKLLRNRKLQKRIYLVLAIAILPPFAVWGVSLSNKEGGRAGSELGILEGRKIRVQEYLASYKAARHEAAMLYGERNLNRPELNLKGRAWDRLLLLNEAKNRGIRTTDAEVVDWLLTQPLFVSKDGHFEDRAYKMYVTEYMRTTPREFEEEVRQRLTIQKVYEAVKNSVSVPDADLKDLYRQRNAEREIQYGVLGWESEKDAVKVEDREIQPVYDIVRGQLTEPERVKLDFILITSSDLLEKQSALTDTGTLEDLAKKYGLTVRQTGRFSKNEAVPEIGLVREILELSFTLKVGAESNWVKTDNGYYKIRVAEKTPETPLSFEQSKSQVRDLIARQKATEMAVEKLKAVRAKVVDGDLEKALKDAGIEVHRLEKFSENSYLPGIGPASSVEKTVDSLNQGDVSEPVSVRAGAAILKVVKDSPVDDAKFEADKEKFRKEVSEEKAEAEVGKLLEKLRNKLTLNLELLKEILPD